MKHFLAGIPLPMAGLALAVCSLGNLFKLWGNPLIGNGLAIIGGVMVFILVLKLLIHPGHVRSDFNNPIIVAVTPTFTMAIMILATYIEPLAGWHLVAQILWLVAVVLHIGLMTYFTARFVFPWHIGKIYPSWFVMYVGIGVIPVTSLNFYPTLGKTFLWIALALYVIVLPIVFKRVYWHKKMPEATLPLIGIIAAPASLCLAGCITIYGGEIRWLAIALLCLAQALYVFVLLQIPRVLRLSFYPSYAALTFPMVISATALTLSAKQLPQLQFLHVAGIIETVIACAIVLYVIIHYIVFLNTHMMKREA
ncbi:TDT family transporter [Brochothrix thermosphacta]|uniref:TDT family transporter n=1 Tax=Brochothrix thermosphacta TaxID=2756 RepID=UPI000D7A1DA0|nr:TDT family transporter [Brochothrix thermosphacta]SPN74501.1 putative permease [Brochothrix thermosphacta]